MSACNRDPLTHSYFNDITCLVLDQFASKGVSEKMLIKLAKRIPIIYPWNKGYNTLRIDVNQRFVDFPWMIAKPTTNEQIIYLLRFVVKYNINFLVRSLGHAFSGVSVGNNVNIYLVDQKYISVHNSIVTAKSGVTLGELALELSKYNLALPAGTVGNVGLAGLSIAGGIGNLTHTYGLTLDHFVEMKAILADGSIVKCNQNENSDLFWLLRGAGANNVAIVVDFTLRAVKLSHVIIFDIRWSVEEFRDVFPLWQKFAPFAPNELNSELDIVGRQTIYTGLYVGRKRDLEVLLKDFLSIGNPIVKIWKDSYINSVRHFSNDIIRQPFFYAKSSFVFSLMSYEAIDIIMKYMRTADIADKIEIDAFGGAVSRVNKNDTAFFARESLYWILFVAYWSDQQLETKKMAWVQGFYDELRPYTSSYSYAGASDLAIKDYMHAYYGDNAERLVEIKRKYDPNNVFKYEQSIPLSL